MNSELRLQVFERDRNCVKCGKYLHDSVAVHHRKLRKQGGKDDITNLVALCSTCHNIAPDSVHQNPQRSYDTGMLVPSFGDPAAWPLHLYDGRVVLLTTEGTYQEIEGKSHGW